ncbi:MAG: insulinase family protein, partial [Chitinophagaceae bacterium]|nr:insulinase family protein [Chitinophagaceae bacterium]
MKHKIIFSIFSLFLFNQMANAQKLDRSIRPKAGPAPEIQMGTPQSFISSNGIKVFVVENHKLPIVNYSIDFDIRPELQGDMTGYKEMIGELLTAGTKTKSKDKFNEELDQLGASLSVGSDGIYMQTLKKNSDKLLALAGEMLTQPNFSQTELDKLKKQTKSGLAQQQDDPEAMSRNITQILNFGKNHPYGEITTEKTVDNIKLDQCKKYFETYFRPNVAYMAIVGDITLEEAKAQVEKNFAKWQKKDVPRATYPVPEAQKSPTVAIVNKSGAVQSVINVTYPINMSKGHPDEIKLKVANGILGGGSSGRLFQNLRETHAWTYGAYSSFQSDELVGAGHFSASCNSTTSATDSSVAEIIKEMKKMSSQKVSKEELDGYKNYMSGTFALGLEDPKTIARFAIQEKMYNMPKDYYKNYLKNVEAVTAEDVMTVSQKYIAPDVAHITVAGDKRQIAEKLKQFGPVTIYDIYGNEQKDEPAPSVPANFTPEDVVRKHIASTGGEAKWKEVKDMTMVMTTEMQGMQINIQTIRKAPNKLSLDVNAMGQSFQKVVFDGTSGYMTMQGQRKNMEEAEIKEYASEASMIRDLNYLDGKHTISLRGVEKVIDNAAYQIEIKSADGDIVNEYYDLKSGFKVKSEQVENTPQG